MGDKRTVPELQRTIEDLERVICRAKAANNTPTVAECRKAIRSLKAHIKSAKKREDNLPNSCFGAPAYTVTASNLDISSGVPLSPMPSYTISSTVPQAAAPSPAEHEDPGFGTHVREAVEIVKDWMGKPDLARGEAK
jgi:hypothetical protein